jgi:TolB-like protein
MNALRFILLFIPALLFAQEKTKIAVMDLKVKAGIDEAKVASLTNLLCTAISHSGSYEVIGRDDMRAMLEHVADKQLLGCDDTKCLVEIGGALGVQMLVAGDIGMVGQTYLINLKLIDIDQTKVLSRISEQYNGDESGLINKIGTSGEALLHFNAARPWYTSTPVRYGLLAAGVVAGACAYLAYAKGERMYINEYTDAANGGDTAKEKKYWDSIQSYDKTANILLGVSGAFFLGGAVTFAF